MKKGNVEGEFAPRFFEREQDMHKISFTAKRSNNFRTASRMYAPQRSLDHRER